MNRSISATLLLGLAAAVLAGIAALFYPWPQEVQQSGKVGQLLFEGFTPSQVRTIEISRYNSDRQALERIQLQRKGERWVIPATADFNANNAVQVARAINAVLDRKVLEKISDDQQDHLKNGVIDPDQFQSAEVRSGLGRRITLKDRNGQALADLIVGFPLQNAEQQALYCVRIPGEPPVYSVPFDLEALTTRFQDWVDPNLLGLRNQQNTAGQLPSSVIVDAYRIDTSRLSDPAAKTRLYRAELGEVEGGLGIRRLEVPAAESWAAVTPSETQKRLLLESTLRQLGNWTFPEVRLKAKPLADFLKSPGSVNDPALFGSMAEFGFRQTAANGSPVSFAGAGGQLTINLETGVKLHAWFGTITGSVQSGTKLNRYLLLLAEVDRDALQEPVAPTAAEGGQLTDEQQRTYQRDLDAWKAKVKTAEDLVAEYNRQFAPWYYALSDEVYQRLMPELSDLPKSPAAQTDEAPASPAVDQAPSGEPAPQVEKTPQTEPAPTDDKGGSGGGSVDNSKALTTAG
jgi:hypothetical protein